jgi:hypothetical protein
VEGGQRESPRRLYQVAACLRDRHLGRGEQDLCAPAVEGVNKRGGSAQGLRVLTSEVVMTKYPKVGSGKQQKFIFP